jgi:hypothetical protein
VGCPLYRLVPLLAAALVLGACQPEPEPPAVGRTGEPEPAQAASPHEPASAPAVRDTSSVDRTPETDPWLFEGIPNFEDLVAGRDGDWLVVLGSSQRFGAPPAPTVMAAADPGLAAAQQRAWNAGRVPFVVASEELPALEPGFTVVVLGPFARAQAERQLAALRGGVPDAYLKEGW